MLDPFFLFWISLLRDPARMLTRNTANVFKDSVWTYIEPNAGVLSACLPYLTNIFGRGILRVAKYVSDFRNNTKSLLRFHERTDKKTKNSSAAERGTQRATHEAYELSNSIDRSPEFKEDKDLSHDSVRHLVWGRTHVWAHSVHRKVFEHRDAEDPGLSNCGSRSLGHRGNMFSLMEPILRQVFSLKYRCIYTLVWSSTSVVTQVEYLRWATRRSIPISIIDVIRSSMVIFAWNAQAFAGFCPVCILL